MKVKIFQVLVVLFSIANMGYAQKKARVSGNLKVDTLWMTYRNWSDPAKSLKEPEMILAGADKWFAIDLPDPKAAYTVELDYMKSHARPLRFLAVPGEQVVVTGWRESNINGSGFYQRWNKLKKELDSLVVKGMQYAFHTDNVSAANDTTEMYKKRIADKIFAYIQSHPKDPVGVMTFDYLRGEELEQAFELLDRSVREGSLGSYAKTKLGRYSAEKEQAAQEKKLKEDEEGAQREKAEKLYAASKKKVLEAGDAMPDLPFTDINGKEVYLSSFKGKYVYIDCWATWCAPCVMMIPKVKALEEAVSGKTDIVFVSISLDEKRASWEKMLKDKKLDGIQLYAGGSSKTLQDFFQIRTIPRFILLNKKGKILSTKLDFAANKGAEQELKNLIGVK